MRTRLTPLFIAFATISRTAMAVAPASDLAAAKEEIAPLLAEMQVAANAHDTDWHLKYYTREESLLFVINDRVIVGFETLRTQQRAWWNDGKTDVVYKPAGDPIFSMPASGLVMVTYFLTSHRTLPDGRERHTRFGISALWQKRTEGWRIIYAHESTVSELKS